MIGFSAEVNVAQLTGEQISNFLLKCSDHQYQSWLPGTHLSYHILKSNSNTIGSIYCFDEFVGPYRLRFNARISGYIPGQFLEWQLIRIIPLPAKLSLRFVDTASGTRLTHQISIGFRGIGKLLDAIIKLLIPKDLEFFLNDHARHEFTLLSEVLRDTA